MQSEKNVLSMQIYAKRGKMLCVLMTTRRGAGEWTIKTFTTFFWYSFHVHVRHVFNIHSLSDTFDLTAAHFLELLGALAQVNKLNLLPAFRQKTSEQEDFGFG